MVRGRAGHRAPCVAQQSRSLFMGLCPGQILEEVRQSLGLREGASAMAHRLAAAAFRRSLDRNSQTPYSLGASEAFDMVYSGKAHAHPHATY